MADATYQPTVYRKHGGDQLIVASSGNITVESGGSITLDSGSSFSSATSLTISSGGAVAVASGGSITVASGGSFVPASGAEFCVPYQLVSSSDTTINNSGISFITGTTVGPDYVMAAPTRAGLWKQLVLNASSSGVTHRATIFTNSTGRLVVYPADGISGNTITLNTSTQHALTLVSAGTSGWVALMGAVNIPALSNKTT